MWEHGGGEEDFGKVGSWRECGDSCDGLLEKGGDIMAQSSVVN